jgi:hypothetical protein
MLKNYCADKYVNIEKSRGSQSATVGAGYERKLPMQAFSHPEEKNQRAPTENLGIKKHKIESRKRRASTGSPEVSCTRKTNGRLMEKEMMYDVWDAGLRKLKEGLGEGLFRGATPPPPASSCRLSMRTLKNFQTDTYSS